MKKRLFLPVTALAALLSLLACPLAMRAAGMTEWEALVRMKLAGVALLLRLVDAKLTYDPAVGSLDDNTYAERIVTLHKGVSYALIGVCDNDCRTLNLKMYDEDGEFIGQNAGSGSTADLEIRPEHTQDFRVRIIMKRCVADPCFWGLGVYNN